MYKFFKVSESNLFYLMFQKFTTWETLIWYTFFPFINRQNFTRELSNVTLGQLKHLTEIDTDVLLGAILYGTRMN